MKNKTDPWSGIPNLKIRGPRRVCYARVEMNGEEHIRSLHIEADPAGANLPDVLDALRAFKLALAKDHFAILQLTRARNEHSTIGDIVKAYKAACAGRDITADTIKGNIEYLGYIVRLGLEPAPADVDQVRASALTVDLLTTFSERRIASVKAAAAAKGWTSEELEQRMKRTSNSVRSGISQARSLFSVALLQSRHYRDLILPDLKSFLGYRPEGCTVAAFVRPAADVWKKIVDDLPALKASHPAQWFALQLGVNCGLRRGSARCARWDWAKELPGGEAELEVRRAKGGHYALRLPADLWAELVAARASTDYIIPATLTAAAGAVPTPAELEADRDATIDAVVAWLRARGLDTRQPFHSLRKIYGNEVVTTHGLTEGQNALGHSRPSLTHQVYAEHRSTRTVKVV